MALDDISTPSVASMSRERRVKIIRISCDIIEAISQGTRPGEWFRIESDIPQGARCIGLHHNFEMHCIEVAFEHPSFPVVPPGEVPSGAIHPPMVHVKRDDLKDKEGGP